MVGKDSGDQSGSSSARWSELRSGTRAGTREANPRAVRTGSGETERAAVTLALPRRNLLRLKSRFECDLALSADLGDGRGLRARSLVPISCFASACPLC